MAVQMLVLLLPFQALAYPSTMNCNFACLGTYTPGSSFGYMGIANIGRLVVGKNSWCSTRKRKSSVPFLCTSPQIFANLRQPATNIPSGGQKTSGTAATPSPSHQPLARDIGTLGGLTSNLCLGGSKHMFWQCHPCPLQGRWLCILMKWGWLRRWQRQDALP